MNFYAYTMSFKYNQMGYGATLVFAILVVIIAVVLLMTNVFKVQFH